MPPCNCAGSGFIDKNHLNIKKKKKKKLRKLFTKGPKYRETNIISWEKAKNTIIKGLNDCNDTRCT